MSGSEACNEATLRRVLEALDENASGEDFSQRVTSSYLIGVYLAVNALQDLFLVVEGPDCTYMKCQYVQGNHDWLSTLTTVSGFHRVVNTALHPDTMTKSREKPLLEVMARVASHPEAGAVALTSMPMAFVTGADYEGLCSEVATESGKEVIHVPGLSLSGDWIGGYSETLASLAKQIDLPSGRSDRRTVAVIGYLHDRNEDDHSANHRQLREMCSVLDLELVSIWLAGQPFEELGEVRRAGTILSLPYGRKAARLLARRTGADLVELPLPFGLGAAEHCMRTLGQRFDREDAAQGYIDGQMSAIAPRVEWLIPFLFQGLRVGYVGDPHLLPGLADTVELLGATLQFAVVTNRRCHLAELGALEDRLDLLAWPKQKEMLRFLIRHYQEHGLDLLITNNHGVNFPFPETAVMEFGFPSFITHALYDRPFLGHAGFMAFVDGMANSLRQAELDRARTRALSAIRDGE